MLSKNKIKFIGSLQRKKKRDEHKLFIAEGEKLVIELIESGFKITYLIALPEFLIKLKIHHHTEVIEANSTEMKKVSGLTTAANALAIVEMPEYKLHIPDLADKLTLVLDDIRDPGNLGTIIRLADWFGIENIVGSKGTVDVYNSKVVQATMGAITRVRVHYLDLAGFLSENKGSVKLPVYGTYMDGISVYNENLPDSCLVIMGNEGVGISSAVENFIDSKISIPSFSFGKGSESLNVAMSTGIILSEFRRRAL